MRKRITKLSIVTGTAVVAALPPLGAMAQEAGGGGGGVMEPTLWTLAGLVVGGIIMGVLYLFYRQTGGFDDPDWVAPIGIIYSSELPKEGDFGGDEEGHHGSHSPIQGEAH